MVWRISGFKTVFLAVVATLSGHLVGDFPLLFTVVLFLGMAYAYPVVEWLFWRSPGKSSEERWRWFHLREGLNGLIVFFGSLFLAMAIASVITGGTLIVIVSLLSTWFGDAFTPELAGLFGQHTGYGLRRSLLSLTFPGWFAIAICLYRYEFWVQQQRSRQKSGISTPPSHRQVKPGPVNSVDLDLDRLRSKLGLTHMKARQPRKPKP